MHIGILQVELRIEHARCLKDKRRVVSSLKDRLHREHMVSVAQIDQQDDCQRVVLGIALVAADVPYCQSVLDRILEKVNQQRDCVLTDHAKEILSGH